MSKLRLATILPAVQVALAAGAILWRYRLAHEELFFPAASFLYHGMSAPAWLLSGLTLAGLNSVLSMISSPNGWTLVSVWGIPLRELLFVLLTGGLWYLIGRTADGTKNPDELKKTVPLLPLWSVFLFALGIMLLLQSISGMKQIASSGMLIGRKPFIYYSLPGEVLLLGWSLVLLAYAIDRFARLLRGRGLSVRRSEPDA